MILKMINFALPFLKKKTFHKIHQFTADLMSLIKKKDSVIFFSMKSTMILHSLFNSIIYYHINLNKLRIHSSDNNTFGEHKTGYEYYDEPNTAKTLGPVSI